MKLRQGGDALQEDGVCSGCTLARRGFVVMAARGIAAALGLTLAGAPARVWALDSGADATDERRYPVPTADGVFIDEPHEVILARRGGVLYAFSLRCPHKGTPLRWQAAQGRFRCPKHDSRYEADGVFISGRATRSMDRYAIRREGESVVVDTARLLREDRERAEWQAAVVRLDA